MQLVINEQLYDNYLNVDDRSEGNGWVDRSKTGP